MRMRVVLGVGIVAFALTGCDTLEKLKGGGSASSAGASAGAVPAAAPTTSSGLSGMLGKALSFAASPFSGEMEMEVRSGPVGTPTSSSTFKVKGTKMRIEAAPQGGGKAAVILVESVEKKMTMLDDTSKTAMVMHLDTMGGGPGAPGTASGGAAGGKKTEFKKTGKSDVVAGYSCEIYAFDGDEPGETGEACIASGLSFLGMGGKLAGGWASSLSSVGGFPLRVVVTQAAAEKSRWEVKRIEKKDVPDAQFEVPAGYKVVDMAEMMKGLGGMGGARPKR